MKQPQDFNQCFFQYKLALCDLENFESSEEFNYMKGFIFLKNEKRKSGNGFKYYENAYLITVSCVDGKRIQNFKYIKKPDLPYIQEKLSHKKQNRLKYKELKAKVKTLRKQLIKVMKRNKMDDKMLDEIEENWCEHELFLKKDKHKNANSISVMGERVRSRGECILAALAFAFKIPYLYEPEINLCGLDEVDDIIDENVHPDFGFYIRGKFVIAEFLGMQDKEYIENWERKRRHYKTGGFEPGENLICIACKDKFNINSQAIAGVFMNLANGFIPKNTVYV